MHVQVNHFDTGVDKQGGSPIDFLPRIAGSNLVKFVFSTSCWTQKLDHQMFVLKTHYPSFWVFLGQIIL